MGFLVIVAVRKFLALFTNPPESEAARIRQLAEILDQLACVYHKLPDGAAYSADAELTGYNDMRKAAVRVFPDFGFYAVVPPEPDPNVKALMGDAIDDLADIALEMKQVEWLWENGDPRDAERHFRFGYQIHWGRHLHDLRSYIHAQQFANKYPEP